MTGDEARQARVEKLIAEMTATIAEAQATSARMTELLREMGVEDDDMLREMIRSDRCSPDLKAMIDEDLAQLERELKDSEAALLVATGHRESRKPHRRMRGMTRI